MFCNTCNKKEATVFLTQIVDGKMQKMNFCETCAQKKGINDPSGFALTELLLGLGLTQDVTATAELTCSVCELTQSQFKKTGRLGCSACYDLFIEELMPMLRNMHPSLVHVGKAPRHFAQEQKEKESIQLLQKQLQKAIAEEHYENAAELRDKILALQDVASTTPSVAHSRDREVQNIFPFEATTDGNDAKLI
ncbi:MAG: UvrB/UvrC motif-containing protein [Chthoniobacterales bacterium]|nr:UvrB/UvrC motif-containing protein [Chthoniobacterales bacterium]